MSAAPEEFLNRALLRQLAGEQLFASGEQCFALGRVRQVRVAKGGVSARVTGNPSRQVKLWRRSGELCFRCDCEAGKAETFCKHCVAVGLAWLSRAELVGTFGAKKADPSKLGASEQIDARRQEERQRLEGHLKTLDASRLASLLLEATDYDEILRRRLLLETIGLTKPRSARFRTGQARSQPNFAAFQQLLQEAIRPNGYVDFHAMPDYVQGIEDAVAPLKALLHDHWYDVVIGLTEFALVELDAASDRVDTGDGLLNRVYETLQRLHLDACREGPSQPMELASRLLHYELEGGLGVFNNAMRTYADILGTVGQAVWRTLLIDEWRQTIGNGEATVDTADVGSPAINHRRFQLQTLMERIARESGDMDALIALKQADLQGVYDYVALAEALIGAGRLKDAIGCAEEAAERFPDQPEKSVWREFLISAYSQAGRHEDAIRLAWDQFAESGEVEAWRELKALVLKHDMKAWPKWRNRGLALIRTQSVEKPERVGVEFETVGPDRSRLIELLIEEKCYDTAWDEALKGGCPEDLWLRLATIREAIHPRDALAVYERQVDKLLATGQRGDYGEVLALIARIRTVLDRLEPGGEFERYRAALRSKHRQKRAFVRLLDSMES